MNIFYIQLIFLATQSDIHVKLKLVSRFGPISIQSRDRRVETFLHGNERTQSTICIDIAITLLIYELGVKVK